MKLLLWLSCTPHAQISTLWPKWVLSITWQEQKADLSGIASQVCQSPFIKQDTYENSWKTLRLLWVCTVGHAAKFGQIILLDLFLQSKNWPTELEFRHWCGIKCLDLLGLVWFEEHKPHWEAFISWLQDLNCSDASTDIYSVRIKVKQDRSCLDLRKTMIISQRIWSKAHNIPNFLLLFYTPKSHVTLTFSHAALGKIESPSVYFQRHWALWNTVDVK